MNGASPYPNLRFQTAGELFAALPEIEQDMLARPGQHDGRMFLEALASSPTPEEAITCAAYALQPRHAIWWGHECLRQADAALTDEDRHMMELAAAWVGSPDEAHRYGAMDAALAAKTKTPGVWLALAAGWNSGSMSPQGQPIVPVPPFLAPRAVNAAVLSALARLTPGERPMMLQRFVRMAVMLGCDA